MGYKITPLLQLTRTECGLCCIAMICQFFGKYKPMSYYRKFLQGSRDGASINDIVNALKKLGIKSVIKEFDYKDLINIKAPILTIIDGNHFVVIEKNKTTNKIVINDPSIGKLVMDRKSLEKRMGNIIITTEKTSEFQEENEKLEEWRPFIKILMTEKVPLFFYTFLSGIIYIGVMFIPIVIQIFIDSIIHYNELVVSNTLIKIGVILIQVYFITNLLKNYVAVKFEACIDKKFLYSVVDKIVNLPYRFFELRTSGDLLFRLNLLNNIRAIVSELIIGSLDAIGVIFSILYAMYISYKLCCITVLLVVLICLITVKINSKIVQLNYYELSELTNITMAESELINSMYDIKSLHVEEFFSKRIKNSYDKFSSRFQKRNWWSKLYNSMLEFFELFLPVFLLLFNLANVKNLDMSIGEIVAFYSISSMLIANSISLIQKYTNIKLMRNSLSRINEILMEDEAVHGNKKINKFSILTMTDACFSYSDNKNTVLKNINLRVKKGEKIAIVGESGSGKSTIVKLLVGLYDLVSGEILYNSTNVKDISEQSLAHLIGVVAQDAALFNRSIKDNITLNRKEVTKQELYSVLRQVGILEEVLSMPMKEETLISEFGKNISGGQRQRLAMARTLINKPEILILDEATSSLDGLNEEDITKFLNSINCTQIIISHRLSTIKNVDYIYVLSHGEIIESGTLNNLSKPDTYFYKIFCSQLNNLIDK